MTSICPNCEISFPRAKFSHCPGCKTPGASVEELARAAVYLGEHPPCPFVMGAVTRQEVRLQLFDVEPIICALPDVLRDTRLPHSLYCGKCLRRFVSDTFNADAKCAGCDGTIPRKCFGGYVSTQLPGSENATAPETIDEWNTDRLDMAAAVSVPGRIIPWMETKQPPITTQFPLPPACGAGQSGAVGVLRQLKEFARKTKSLASAKFESGDKKRGWIDTQHTVLLELVRPLNARFFAAVTPWLTELVGWSLLRSVDVTLPENAIWLVLRVLPRCIPRLSIGAPPPQLKPSEFEQCGVEGMDFLRVYVGRDEAEYQALTIRLARGEAAPLDPPG